MRRTAALAELEFIYIYALQCSSLDVGEDSLFFTQILDYIDSFFDKVDVQDDIKHYLELMMEDDAKAIQVRLRTRVEEVEEKSGEELTLVKADGNPAIASHLNQTVEQDFNKVVITLETLRWKFVQHKVCRTIGLYGEMENMEKIDLVNRIWSVFLSAMEYHPKANTNNGHSTNHNQAQYDIEILDKLTGLDRKNAEDMVIVAIECMYEVKIYDFSVFNPINFQMIQMCEFALFYYPESVPLYTWLIKLYAKLGCVTLVNKLTETFPAYKLPKEAQEANFERIGATRFSIYTDFGMQEDLEKLV